MSDEDVRTVRSGFEAFGRGDVDGLLDLVHDDVDASFLLGPILGVDAIHGKDALRRFLADQLFEAFDEFSAETLSFDDLGGEVPSRLRATEARNAAPSRHARGAGRSRGFPVA